MRCRDYLGNTGDCRFDTTECEHHVTIPDAPPKWKATEWRELRQGDSWFSPEGNLYHNATAEDIRASGYGKRWIAVKDAPAKPEPVVRYWRYNKNEHVYKVEDGRVVEFVPPGGKVIVASRWTWNYDNGDDVEITAAEYEAAKHPAPEVSASATVGNPVKPIEPLVCNDSYVELCDKVNEIIERLNGKGGV
jgi:hypothetical protein